MKLKIINGLMFGIVLYLLIDKYRKKKECKCDDKPFIAPIPEKTNETTLSATTDPVLQSTNVTETKPISQPIVEQQPTPTPVKTLLHKISLGQASSKEGVCGSPSYNNKWMNAATFGSSSKLYSDSNGENIASSGYYTDGTYWRHWDASAQTFSYSGGCSR